YFKEKETFDMDEFANEVIANKEGIESFKSYKKNYEEEFDSPIADSFDISDAAVKKQAKAYKNILKLDKNFHIYIHGNKELIEKGFDDDRSMNFYKVYFRDEQ
ncbi:MAG: nucleoid-associated protein, partial [Chitinophagaceae bacterium]